MFHHQAADEGGSDDLGGAAKEVLGKCWEVVATKGMALDTIRDKILYNGSAAFMVKKSARQHLFTACFCLALLTSTQARAESVSEVTCEAAGDYIILSSTGEAILEQRLVSFKELEPYGLNTTGSRGGQRAVCRIKNDPAGYKWVSCGKSGGGYVTYDNGFTSMLRNVVKAVPNEVQYRGWSGACLVKL